MIYLFFLSAGITASQESITITEQEPVIMRDPEVLIITVALAAFLSESITKHLLIFSHDVCAV